MNYGRGDLFNFHGAFAELKDALAKEKQVPGAFIRDVYYRGGPRYGILTRNPRARKRNVEWGTYENGIFHPWTHRPKTRKKRAVRRRNAPPDKVAGHEGWKHVMAAKLLKKYKSLRRSGYSADEAMAETLRNTTAGPGAIALFRSMARNPKRRNALGALAILDALSDLKALGVGGEKGRRRNVTLNVVSFRKALAKLYPGKRPERLTRLQLANAIHEAQAMQGKAKRGNPTKRNYADATDLYTQFHGRSPHRVTDTGLATADYDGHPELAQLGKLVSLTIGGSDWRKKIQWGSREAPDLAATPNGKQLYIVGGVQNFDSSLERLPTKQLSAGRVLVGSAYQIEYFTQKHFDNFQPVTYYHSFGEDSGERPHAVYDRRKKRIHLVGGAYVVKPEGIVN